MFSVILTDLNLPEKNRLDLIDELRSADEGMIKIVITGHATLGNAVISLHPAAYDFIEKPVMPDALMAIVNRAPDNRAAVIRQVFDQLAETGQREAATAFLQRWTDAPTQAELGLYYLNGTG